LTVDELLGRGTRVLLGEDATRIRDRFINEFVDVDAEWYKTHIATLKRYHDGDFYSGYLWEVVSDYTRISEDQAAALALDLGASYALWDLHSAEKIVVPEYWKFPRESVLQGKASDIYEARALLPKDLYIFQENCEDCLILTHEDEPDGVAIILEARPRQHSESTSSTEV
jgi:hypothetical protein